VTAARLDDVAIGSMRRVAATALAGTSIEWYDFFLYGTAAALVFPTLYFPADLSPLVALIASFSTFAVGFLARPIGGVVFGHFGDRVGRKKALVTALLLMGTSTTLIGCLPSYATIGSAAPLLLVVLRFAQGFAIGGQWGGAMLLVTESAPPHQRGFYGAFAQAGAPMGVILANLAFLLVSSAVSDDSFMSWGWRLPFLASVVLIGLSLYVQLHVEETASFRQLATLRRERIDALLRQSVGDSARHSGKSPVLEALRAYPREIMLAAGAFLAIQVAFYILIAFVIAYGSNAETLNLPRDRLLIAVLIGSVVQIPVLFGAGAWSDRYGRRGIYMLGAVLGGVWAFVLFPLIDTGSFAAITVAICGGQVFLSMMYGPQAALLAELFATRVRYSGASLGYQLGAILGGALAPVIATALLAQFGDTRYISAYIALASAITLICVWQLSETHRNELAV
jgi:metabolite-proton symporter